MTQVARCAAGNAGALLVVLAMSALPARAQVAGTLQGRVVDAIEGTPIPGADVSARSLSGVTAPGRTVTLDTLGTYRFSGLPYGRYALRVNRFGYRPTELVITLDRAEPLTVSVALDPIAFPLQPISLEHASGRDQALAPPSSAHRAAAPARANAVQARQVRYLAADVRQLDYADLRESNTLAEFDVFRTLQSGPGVARRDDFTADLWTRGAGAGQTMVLFDGVPVVGALHALGALAGPNTDMLRTARFHPGVASAALPGAGAATIELETRSPMQGARARALSLSPISLRFTTDGMPSERFAWAVGARRSHLDMLAALADIIAPGNSSVLDYSFADVTARADLRVARATRLELSAFVQQDRVFGSVPRIARGNEGVWGTRVARASAITPIGTTLVQHTLGWSVFDAAVRASGQAAGVSHPVTDNRFNTLLWESRIAASSGAWAAGFTATHERHDYDGPAADPASVLTPEDLAVRGIVEFGPIVRALERARRVDDQKAQRLAVWTEHAGRLPADLQYQAGVRVETGTATPGGSIRVAPRLMLRWAEPASPLAISAAYGRSYQYTQSVARTDVVRTGLRVSEVLVQAGRETDPLRSDVLSLGVELWREQQWLFGVTTWLRASDGILLPDPATGPHTAVREPRPALGSAHGVELSARRLEGRVRGFANYSLSRSRQRIGSQRFDAPEDRRHVANLSLLTDISGAIEGGGTFRFESGAPFTRLTMIPFSCSMGGACEIPPLMIGTPSAQRGPAYAALDLMAEWTRERERWALSVYGQIRNVLGRSNAVTYHSSCICVSDDGFAMLEDRFDRGVPRLPVLGLRARF